MSTYDNRHHCRRSRSNLSIFIMAVLIVAVQGTFGQSLLLTLSPSQGNFFNIDEIRERFLKATAQSQSQSQSSPVITFTHLNEKDIKESQNIIPIETIINNTFTDIYSSLAEFGGEEDNSTIILIEKFREKSTELSKTAMDVITIIWYVATFLALAAFFLLMICSDRRCNAIHGQATNGHGDSQLEPPPSPSPSYSEFAPPSYESVMKMQHAAKPSVFVIQFNEPDNIKDTTTTTATNNNISSSITDNNNNRNTEPTTPHTPTTPVINFYTVNELQKFGS